MRIRNQFDCDVFPKCNSHNSLSVHLASATEEVGQNQEVRWFYGPFVFMAFDLKSPDSKDERLGWELWLVRFLASLHSGISNV